MKNHHKLTGHPNIIDFLGLCKLSISLYIIILISVHDLCISNYKDKEEGEDDDYCSYCMVFAYADGGPLHKYLEDHSNRLTWCDKYKLALAITNGLKYMHDHDIIHKDLVMCQLYILIIIYLMIVS